MMAARVDIELEQSWETIDEATDYFLGLVLDLKALKRLPEPPTELYLRVEIEDVSLQEKVDEQGTRAISIWSL